MYVWGGGGGTIQKKKLISRLWGFFHPKFLFTVGIFAMLLRNDTVFFFQYSLKLSVAMRRKKTRAI